VDQDLDNPDSPCQTGTFLLHTPINATLRPRIQA